MDLSDPLDPLRTQNFLTLLRQEFRDSPKQFELRTGYSSNMVSQIKGGHKVVKYRLARKLEKLLSIPAGTLDEGTPPVMKAAVQPASVWPFSITLEDFLMLSPKVQREIDETLMKLVIGAQAQEMLAKQQQRKRNRSDS